MILDHVITHREFRWLGSEQDKIAHFLTTTCLERDALPRLAFGEQPDLTVRYFPDKLPIGVSPDGRRHASYGDDARSRIALRGSMSSSTSITSAGSASSRS